MSSFIIPSSVPLRIVSVVGDTVPLVVVARMTAPTARCPQCGHPSARIHSRYWRSPQDLPWQTIPVRWHLECRKFWCDTPDCPQTIFCERLPSEWLGVHPQRTQPGWDWLTAWGWTASAADVARVAQTYGVPVSADTVIRALRRAPDPPMGDVRVMGVDEWALRKGQTYATILVDLEPHRIVDVLPDDQPATLTTWLRAPPTIQVLTRDRDDAFAKAFAAGAPTAQPVADRFHLLKNLRHVLERVFTRHGVGPAPTPSPALPDPAPPRDPPPPTAPSSRQQDRWRQIQALRQAGHSISAIARILGLDRATVRKYATASTCPTPPPRPATPHALAGWTDRLEALWQSGLHRGRALFRQLRTAGYAGSESAVRRWVRRRHPRPSAGATPPRSRTSPATRAWQCLQWPADWAPQTVHALTAALQDPTIREALTLAQLFRRLWPFCAVKSE
jgi:DNA-binding NarL/FixJ family response regulator